MIAICYLIGYIIAIYFVAKFLGFNKLEDDGNDN